MIKRTWAIAKKEMKQLRRDTKFLFVLLFFPMFLLGIFGYAVNFDVQNIKLAVWDQENSPESRLFVNSLLSSPYFIQTATVDKDADVKRILDEKDAQAVLVIPIDFSKAPERKETATVQFLVDGVDGNTASIISNYVNIATISYNNDVQSEMMARHGAGGFMPINLETTFWFNPELQSTKFLIPGLIAMILIVTAVVSVALSLVREKEKGTIEQINVSSLTIIELLLGKIIPYTLISLIDAALILFLSYILFDIAVAGSYLLLFLTTLLFVVSTTSLGIFISVIADSQQVAFAVAVFASMLPSVILSGFIFPIDGMNWAIQILTNITPSKFYIVILRAIMLRGVGVSAFWDQIFYLILFAVFFMGLATIMSKRKERLA